MKNIELPYDDTTYLIKTLNHTKSIVTHLCSMKDNRIAREYIETAYNTLKTLEQQQNTPKDMERIETALKDIETLESALDDIEILVTPLDSSNVTRNMEMIQKALKQHAFTLVTTETT